MICDIFVFTWYDNYVISMHVVCLTFKIFMYCVKCVIYVDRVVTYFTLSAWDKNVYMNYIILVISVIYVIYVTLPKLMVLNIKPLIFYRPCIQSYAFHSVSLKSLPWVIQWMSITQMQKVTIFILASMKMFRYGNAKRYGWPFHWPR